MITGPPMCQVCKHLRELEGWPTKPRTCDAFPDGIPPEVLTNAQDHRKPIKGDHGIQFELEQGKELPVAFR